MSWTETTSLFTISFVMAVTNQVLLNINLEMKRRQDCQFGTFQLHYVTDINVNVFSKIYRTYQ